MTTKVPNQKSRRFFGRSLGSVLQMRRHCDLPGRSSLDHDGSISPEFFFFFGVGFLFCYGDKDGGLKIRLSVMMGAIAIK